MEFVQSDHLNQMQARLRWDPPAEKCTIDCAAILVDEHECVVDAVHIEKKAVPGVKVFMDYGEDNAAVLVDLTALDKSITHIYFGLYIREDTMNFASVKDIKIRAVTKGQALLCSYDADPGEMGGCLL